MEAALGTANWLLGQVLNKLSDDWVKAYAFSAELGPNLDKIETEMQYTKGLLDVAQGRDIAGNTGLQRLLEMLGKKADEAEDALDELHYFMIQDKLDGTRDATPELGDGLGAKVRHAHHAARHTAGKYCENLFLREIVDFHRFSSQDDVLLDDVLVVVGTKFRRTLASS